MDADLKQAVLECVSAHIDQYEDRLPWWMDTMIDAYCVDDGIEGPDRMPHMEREIAEYRVAEARIEARCVEVEA